MNKMCLLLLICVEGVSIDHIDGVVEAEIGEQLSPYQFVHGAAPSANEE